jgi:hypothetical protein
MSHTQLEGAGKRALSKQGTLEDKEEQPPWLWPQDLDQEQVGDDISTQQSL